jgi:predicted helicase
MFLVKKMTREKKQPCTIYQTTMEDEWKKEVKLQWLTENTLQNINFIHVHPDKKGNWTNIEDNDFESLLPLADKNVKTGKSKKALFEMFSLGIASHRDSWVYDLSRPNLEIKIKYFIEIYQKTLLDNAFPQKGKIAWDSDLIRYCDRKIEKRFESDKVVTSLFRPYTKRYFYFDKHLNGRLYRFSDLYKIGQKNLFIAINREGNSKPFHCLGSENVIDLHTTGDSQCLPLYYFDENGKRVENITEWGLNQFFKHYGKKGINKETIFQYVYAILHNQEYRKKYELNLKREFPRIPFYEDFGNWAAWGKTLMDLHINYETVEPYNLQVIAINTKEDPKAKLKADKENGAIFLDENTSLSGIPKEVWTYKLGNRSALEWILDQYKESKPKDPTIAEKFNTYKFADYKPQVIDLLKRVCTVSVETMKIIKEMK